MLSHLHLIPERHGQTDRQTDGQTELLYQYRASHFFVYSRRATPDPHHTWLVIEKFSATFTRH